jgi:hypothetical protein
LSWSKLKSGVYGCTDGKFNATVALVGELWINTVYYEGEIIDKGEWDGRGAAFRNTRRAMRNGVLLRNPIQTAEEEEDDDVR